MTGTMNPDLNDEICLRKQDDKKVERIEHSNNKQKNKHKLRKPQTEKLGLTDDPEFLKLVILNGVFKVY